MSNKNEQSDISIPREVWEVIRSQARCVTSEEEYIAMLNSLNNSRDARPVRLITDSGSPFIIYGGNSICLN